MHAHAQGDAHLALAGQREDVLTQSFTQALANQQCLIVGGARQHDGKFFSAHTPDQILGAQGIACENGKLLQHHVALRVAIAVVDGLKVVNIHHQHGHLLPFFFQTCQQFLSTLHQGAPCQHAGQKIVIDRMVELAQRLRAQRVGTGHSQRGQRQQCQPCAVRGRLHQITGGKAEGVAGDE